MEVQVLSPAHASPCPQRFAKRCGRVSRSTKKIPSSTLVRYFSFLYKNIYSRGLRGSVSGTSAIMNPERRRMSAIAKNALTVKSTDAGI